jgi:hypothetical protein
VAVALAVIVILGAGLPVGGWLLTRRKKFFSSDRHSGLAGDDDIDRWLADRYHLSWTDRDRVRAAVMLGHDVPHILDAPVRGLAAAVLANQFTPVRRARRNFCGLQVTGVVYLLVMIVLIWTPKHSGGDWGLFGGTEAIFLGLLLLRLTSLRSLAARPGQIRRNAERAMKAGSPAAD